MKVADAEGTIGETVVKSLHGKTRRLEEAVRRSSTKIRVNRDNKWRLPHRPKYSECEVCSDHPVNTARKTLPGA